MASRTPPPARPIPSPPGEIGAGLQQVGNAVNEATLKQAETKIANQIYAENEAKGLGVIKVGVDASPEDLKQAAAKAKAALNLPSVGANSAEKGAQGLSVASNKGPPVIPTLTVEDVDASPTTTNKAAPPAPSASSAVIDTKSTPGDLPAGKAPVVPEWYKAGWQPASDDDSLSEETLKDKSILMQFINEQYYGEWYHNAAIIVVAVVMTHLITLLRLGWGWIIILLAFCCTYYSTSMERFRRRAKDDMQRELTKTRLENEEETADWMNNFLERFWKIYVPVLNTTIQNSVSQILSTSTPAFLDSLRLTTFTLGNKAPHIDHVRTHPRTDDDTVLMEWGISFTPNDVENMTYKQARLKENPKIVLEVRVGKGLTAAMPILVEDITFKGVMKIRMKLVHSFPHIQIVDLSFMEKPWFDYVLKPIGGETFGLDIASVPGLSPFIRDTVHSILGPMMYEPNVFTLNLEQLMSGVPLDTAIGVLQITIISASGIKANKIGGGTPDPYVAISINNTQALEQTKWKESTRTPVWNETKFVLVSALSGSLILTVWDYNEHRNDHELGVVNWDLNQLVEDSSHEGIVSKVLIDGKERGELKFDVSFFPVIKPAIVNGQPEPIPETSVGIVRLVLHQAKELDSTKNKVSKDLDPYVKLFTNNDFIHSTPVTKHSNNPIWESPKEFLCADKSNCVITVKVIDDRDFMKDPVIGYASIKLEDMLQSKKEGKDWFPLSGCKSGRIRISAEWKPLDMAGSLHGAAKYVPPIGIVRILMKKAVDVKNVEGGLGGKSDPYVRVMINNTIMARTEVINNNLSPVWDQFMYIPVHALRETLYFEIMDYQHLTKDRPLGHVELDVAALAAASGTGDNKYPFESLGLQERVDRIKVDNEYKGELHFTAEFIPALHLAGVSFDDIKNPLQMAVEEDDKDDSDHEGQDVPVGLTYTHVPKKDENGSVKAPASENGDATKKENGATNGAPANGAAAANGDAPKVDPEGFKLTKEEILASPSGVIVFDVQSGHLAKKSRLEILMDDGYWPVFTTQKSRTASAVWDMVGEGFIKELDFGRVWLRLNTNGDGEKEDIIAEYKVDAKEFLERALDGPTDFTLSDIDGENQSTVKIAAKFVPVPIVLSPRESMSNQGNLRVEILEGREIHGADRSGTSDPYVVLSLNGERVHKTDTKKKTLTPVWNETCECTVPSRVGAEMVLECYDWNQIGQDECIGKANLDLAALEPFHPVQVDVPLENRKHGQKGFVTLRMVFTPQIIAKSRKSTSTFSTAGRAVNQVGNAPIAVGKGVIGGVGTAGKGVAGGVGAVGKGVKGLFGGGRKGSDADAAILPATGVNAAGIPVIQEPPSTQVTEQIPGAPAPAAGYSLGNDSQTFPKTPTSGSPMEGVLRVTVQNGKDLADSDGDQVRPYVILSMGGKKIETKHVSKTNNAEWDESFTFQVGPESKTLHLEVMDNRTFGKDKSIGQTDIAIWDKLQPSGPNPVSSAIVSSELRQGVGQLTVRLEFEQSSSGLGARAASIGSFERPAFGSPGRFSMRKAKSPFAE